VPLLWYGRTRSGYEQEYKEKGNYLYKQADYKGAAGQYHRALLYMKVGQISVVDP
jgi:hypothetical protein